MSDPRWNRSRAGATLLATLAALVAGHAEAILPPPRQASGEVALAAAAMRAPDPLRQQALSSGAAWRGFVERHGDWNALWNERTATPHRAFGRGIPLAGFTNDEAGVDRAVRRFAAAHTALFGAGTRFARGHVRRSGDTWYASYAQEIDGLEVLFADFEFRVGTNGNMFLFGADEHVAGPEITRAPRIAGAAARAAARAGLPFDPARDRVEGGERLFLLPHAGDDGRELRVVYETRVITQEPPGDWLTFVDAGTGDVLYRVNRVRYAVSGTVTGLIHPTRPDDPRIERPLPHLYVQVGGTQAVTDTAGFYTAAAAGTVTVSAELKGRWADVNRSDGALDASYSTSAADPATVNIPWGGAAVSHDAERDAYYHVNIAHDHLKALDPSMTTLDFQMPIYVNAPSTCNAFWSGGSITLFAAGGGCVNTATVPDVVYHEYGHGVNDWTYIFHGSPSGMANGALHEGMADVYAAFLEDDPIIGAGFSGPGTFVRNVDNSMRWPADRSGEVHSDGLIVAGAWWDLRERVGLVVAEGLSQEVRHGRPDDQSDILAFTETFLETLVADDDDADLANGTPHGADIVAAFNAHGIGTNFYLFFNPVAVGDPPAGGMITIESVVNYLGPAIAALDAGSPTVHWRVNRGAWDQATMTPTEEVLHFAARIPAPEGAVVEYYLTAADTYGGLAYLPAGAPATLSRFYVGSPATAVAWNMETDPGWTAGAAGDAAFSGLWVRANPLGTYAGEAPNHLFIQPANDHTQPGALCFVTGNGDSLQGIGFDDVDGGATTLTTAVFDALTGMEHPIVEYWRWYVNNAGSPPFTDVWQVDISNDGGATWTPVESTTATEASWQRILFRVEDYVIPTANMRMRFIASDFPTGSIVEAAVDDFRLLGFAPGTVSAAAPAAPALALAPAWPNPSHGPVTLRLSLPARGRATLVLYDVNGRTVRTLLDGDLAAGTHTAAWDGRDAGGRPAAAGLYFARLRTERGERVQRVVRAN